MSINHVEDLNLPEVKLEAGSTIIEEGVKSSKIYILQTGTVKVVANNEELCTVDVKGAVFGDVSVLLDTATTARVEVTEDASFLVIEDAPNFLKNQPELIFGIAQILASRLTYMNKTFVDMRQNTTKNKVIGKLSSWMLATNSFFDRDMMHPFHEANKKESESQEETV
ncbi:MAG: cyclic nucleotide-binding domain-containing protein [Lentisphaeraceae bacterium]|nr:cyclic nucleotide-binding domain-containing protein [Lentisphaeraceae bacterium]